MVYLYSTASLVESELRATTPFSPSTSPLLSEVTTWIEEESAEINRIANTIFGSTTSTIVIDYNGEDYITLPKAPIVSINSFQYTEYLPGDSNYPTWVSKTENTDFVVYSDTGEIALVSSKFNPKEGMKNIRIAYTYGYTTIPEYIKKLATKMVAQRVLNTLISQNVNEGNDGGSISVGSISIVEPASYGVSSYKQLKTDIEDLKKKLVLGSGVYRY